MARTRQKKEKDILDQMLDNIDFRGLTPDVLLVLRHYHRLDCPGLVAGDCDPRALVFQQHRFFGVPVAAVPAVVPGVRVFPVPEVHLSPRPPKCSGRAASDGRVRYVAITR